MNFDHFGGDAFIVELEILIKSDTSHGLIDWGQNLQVNPF
jgi:hypothetical protein